MGVYATKHFEGVPKKHLEPQTPSSQSPKKSHLAASSLSLAPMGSIGEDQSATVGFSFGETKAQVQTSKGSWNPSKKGEMIPPLCGPSLEKQVRVPWSPKHISLVGRQDLVGPCKCLMSCRLPPLTVPFCPPLGFLLEIDMPFVRNRCT